MMCDDVQQLAETYVDGELDAACARALEAHAATCASCQRRLDETQALSATLRAAPRFRAPGPLAAQIRAMADTADSQQAMKPRVTQINRRRWSPWLTVAASIATLVLAFAGGQQYRAAVASSDTVRAVVDGHVRSLMAGHLTDVPSSDRHTVKPWFAGRVDFSPPVVDLAADGDPLLGGRLDYIDGHAAAALVYRHGNHTMNVFLWPGTAGSAAHVTRSDARGYQVISWNNGGLTVWVVSDLALDELRDFARRLDAAMHSS